MSRWFPSASTTSTPLLHSFLTGHAAQSHGRRRDADGEHHEGGDEFSRERLCLGAAFGKLRRPHHEDSRNGTERNVKGWAVSRSREPHHGEHREEAEAGEKVLCAAPQDPHRKEIEEGDRQEGPVGEAVPRNDRARGEEDQRKGLGRKKARVAELVCLDYGGNAAHEEHCEIERQLAQHDLSAQAQLVEAPLSQLQNA
jgi:hypothetical protein